MVPENEILSKLARIEVTTDRGKPFLQKMREEIGPTEHQIKYRREKETYKKYLAIARKPYSQNKGPAQSSQRINKEKSTQLLHFS